MAKKSCDCIIIQMKEWFNCFLEPESTVNTLRSFAFLLQKATSLWTSWRRSHHLGWVSGSWFTLKHQRASPPSILTAMTSQLGPWVPESAHLLLSISSRKKPSFEYQQRPGGEWESCLASSRTGSVPVWLQLVNYHRCCHDRSYHCSYEKGIKGRRLGMRWIMGH